MYKLISKHKKSGMQMIIRASEDLRELELSMMTSYQIPQVRKAADLAIYDDDGDMVSNPKYWQQSHRMINV